MKFKVEIDCDNAAFQTDPEFEVARILSFLARQVKEGYVSFPKIRDANGNVVGEAGFVEESEGGNVD